MLPMRKKQLITLIFFMLLASVAVVCFLPSSEPQVVGAVSPGDLAEIKRIVNDEIWRGTLPDHSWAVIKRLPENIIRRFPKHILRIDAGPEGFARATISTGKTKPTRELSPAYYVLYLQKSTTGWRIFQPDNNFDPLPRDGRGF
jgi:hypothetical protein